MRNLAGLSSLEFLKELYASYNDIDDLFDISYCRELEVLDLEGNNIVTWDNVSYLMGLSKLTEISLAFNPIAKDKNYQNKVKEILTQVRYIDDVHVGAIEYLEPLVFPKEYQANAFSILDEKLFVLSKFAKFSISVDSLEAWADEAIK